MITTRTAAPDPFRFNPLLQPRQVERGSRKKLWAISAAIHVVLLTALLLMPSRAPREKEPQVAVAMLGVDYVLENGAYRIAKICEGAPWDLDAHNPIRQAGVDISEGDYLLAVNGVPVDVAKDPWTAFLGLAGRTVELTVSKKPSLDDDARTVAVKALTITEEWNLRYRGWIEKNRAYVEEKTAWHSLKPSPFKYEIVGCCERYKICQNPRCLSSVIKVSAIGI